MNVELFLHGTPDGLDAYSTSTEHDTYVDSFYSSDYRDQSMIVETKIKENKIFSYYTYFRQNVISTKNRQGYFGLTIRIDSFFMTNLQVMYQLLDVIYNQSILGIIISEGKERKYIVSKFQVEGKKICDNIIKLLSLTIKPKSVIVLDDSFLGNSGSPIMFNPCDENCTNALNQYKSAEKIIISPSASLPREQIKAKEYQEKIDYIRKESEDRTLSQIKKMKKENDSLQSEIKQISSKLQNNEREGEVLKQKICNLEKELQESHYKVKQLSDQAELKKELVKISDPLLRLNGLLQRIGIVAMPPQKNPASIRRIDADVERRKVEYVSSYKSAKNLKFFSIILIITSILLLGVLVFQIMLFSKYNHYVPEPKVNQLSEISNIESLDNQVQANKEYYEDAKIEIKGYSGKGGLQYGKEYVLFLSNRDSQPIEGTDGVIWDCDGGIIDNLGGSHAHLKIKRDSGSVRIVCHLPNGQQLERELGIQSLVVSDILDKRSEPYPVPDNKKEKGIHHVSKLKDSGKYKSER